MKKIISLLLSLLMLLMSCPVVNIVNASESVFIDPERLSDENFFGVWENDSWVVESKINYDYCEDLKTVEDAVKSGDYYKAKADLMYYYQNRRLEPVLSSSRDSLSAKAQYNDIYYSQSPISEIFEVSETPGWYEVDVTSNTEIGVACFTLHMLERDFGEEGTEAIVSFNSKESGENVAYLEVEQGGKVYNFPCSGDMYIRAGRYASLNYGEEDKILVSEWLPEEGTEIDAGISPASNGTRQAHLRFNTSALDADTPITRATMKIYGSSTVEGKEVVVFKSTITTTWDEKEITWLLYPNQIFSFQGIEGGYTWKNAADAHLQHYNVTNRLVNLSSFFVEARESNNPEYQRKALEVFIDYIKDVNGLTNDWYASEKRLNAAFRNSGNSQECFFSALHFSELDPISFGALIKFMWQETEAMSGPPMEGQINLNGLSAVISSLLRFCTYFPEFTDRDRYIEKANEKLFEWIEQSLFEDGSYRESSSGYDAGVLADISGFYDIVKGSDISIPEEFKPYYRKFAVSQMNLTQPNKQQFRWGDGGIKRDMGDRILAAAENLDDDELLYYGTNGKEGILPDYTSYFAPVGKLGVMRSDWTDRGVAAFIIGRIGGSHGHHHMNHINLYAYDRILLKDTGRASYDARHPAVAWQTSRAESHSTVEINDHGQKFVGDESLFDDSIVTMSMNSKMDFYSGESHAYPEEAVHTRKFAFVKNHKFYIVTDFLENLNGQENKYNQVWHVNATGNEMNMDEISKIVKTGYNSGANLSIVPVSPSNLSVGEIATNPLDRHVSYIINSDKNAYMSVILYPFENEAIDITTREIPVSSNNDNTATAFSISIPDGTEALYYVNNDSEKIHRFDRYDADAGMFYIERNQNDEALMFSAGAIKSIDENNETLLKTNRVLSDVSVSYKGKFLEVECSDEFDEEADFIMIKAPEKSEIVRFNGEIVPFFKLNGCIVIGTYSENLRYSIENNKAITTLSQMKIEYPFDGGILKAEISNGSILTTEKEWDGKLVLSKMNDTEFNAGTKALGEIEILQGETDIPIRFSVSGNKNYRVAPIIDNAIKEPTEELLEDTAEKVLQMQDVCAYYADNNVSVVYSKKLGNFVFYTENSSSSAGNSSNNTEEKVPNSGHIGGTTNNGENGGNGGNGSSGGTGGGGNSSEKPEVIPPVETKVNPFNDISSHWAKEDILDLYEDGIVNGEGEQFYPDRSTSRAEVTAMIVRAAKLDMEDSYHGMFSDVNENSWFAKIVETAAKNGIVSGNGDGFAPYNNITRAELCKIIMNTYRVLSEEVVVKKEISFSDSEEFPFWATGEIVDAVSLGVLQGYPDGSFSANSTATRAEVAVVIKRLMDIVNK